MLSDAIVNFHTYSLVFVCLMMTRYESKRVGDAVM